MANPQSARSHGRFVPAVTVPAQAAPAATVPAQAAPTATVPAQVAPADGGNSAQGIRRVVGGVEMIKKVAPRLVMEEDMVAPKVATDLYIVLGVATGVKSGSTNYGPWTAVTGQFEVIRLKDGKRFLSGQAHLPEPFNTMLAANVLAQLQPDENGQIYPPAIKFALTVTIKPSSAPIGYEYVAKPHIEAVQADALADLRIAIAGLLPAPVSASV